MAAELAVANAKASDDAFATTAPGANAAATTARF
jgi:hypothetical protein